MAGRRRKKKTLEHKESKETKKRKKREDEDEESSSDTEDLPSALSPKKKSKYEYEKGDLVFAKFRTFPYWPALFHQYRSRKKASVYFFEESTIDNKKTLSVPISSIKPYTCQEKEYYITEGKKKYQEDFQCGLERAHEYLQKRVFLEVPDLFADDEDEDDNDDEDDDQEVQENGNEVVNTSNRIDENDGDIEEEQTAEQEKKLNSSIFKSARKSQRKQRAESKPYVNWIIKNGKERLYKIRRGLATSERHRIFFHGSQKERDGLKYSSGCGPVKCEQQSEKLLNILTEWYNQRKEFIDESVNVITYVSDVWLPESIILSIQHLKKVSHEEAEDILLNG